MFRSLKKEKKKSIVWRYTGYVVGGTVSLVFYFSRDDRSYPLFLNCSKANSFAVSLCIFLMGLFALQHSQGREDNFCFVFLRTGNA